MSKQNLRNLPRISYYEWEEPNFDEYVPSKTNFPSHVPRAALTIPSVFLHLAPSSIPGAGIGVFSTLTLPAGVRFGPYRGIMTKDINSDYCWQIYNKANRPSHVVDGADAERSNWMRYVNCSRHWSEQNLLAYQYKGQVYYRTIRIIPRFTELLVYYGSEFANILNVDLNLYNSSPQVFYENLCKRQSEKQVISNPSTSTVTQISSNASSNNNRENKENQVKSKRKLDKDRTVTKKQKIKKLTNIPIDVSMDTKRKPKKTKTNVLPKKKENKTPKNCRDKQMENINGSKTSVINTIAAEFKCNECGILFSTKDTLTDHSLKCIKTKTLVNGSQLQKADTCNSFPSEMYSCDICTFKTNNKRSIESHLKMHAVTKVFCCNICEYRCAKKSNLEYHMRTHTGEKPYTCNICEFRCAKQDDLKRHTRTHTGEKPFVCNICDYRFARKDLLKHHMLTHTGEKPYTCNICAYRFTRKSNLKSHLKTHTDEKPYACNICEFRCAKLDNLKRHLRTHTGEKPYTCNICDYRFTRKGNLKSHLKTHTDEKPYACNICEYKCAHRSNLKRHLKIHN